MATAAEVKPHQGHNCIGPHFTVREAINKLLDSEASALAVLGKDKELLGVVGERDLLKMAMQKESTWTPVSEIMATPHTLVRTGVSVEDLLWLMHSRKLSVVPVIDADGNFVELLSLSDVLERRVQDLNIECKDLERFIVADSPGG